MKQEDKHHLSIQKIERELISLKWRKDTAYECFCEAINFNPKYPPPYFNLGNILMEKKYIKVIANYIKSNNLDKKIININLNLIGIAESGEFQNSIRVFENY